MNLATACRKVRGEQSRREFAEAIRQETGIALSASMIQKVEEGVVQGKISKTILALVAYYPPLVRLILPDVMLNRICEWWEGKHGESGGSPPTDRQL